MLDVSIIVCTYNREIILPNFLKRLEFQILSSNLKVEVIIVDNNSTDNTHSVLTNYASESQLNISILKEMRQGANYARNAGINNAVSNRLVFIDDDVDFSENWLLDYVSYMTLHSECRVVSGKIIPKFSTSKPNWLEDNMLCLYGLQDYGNSPKNIEFPEFPVEMNMAINKSVFEEYGGFSTEFSRDDKTLMSNDGKYFFYQLSQHNETVTYIPNALLYHLIPESRITPSWIIRRSYWQGVSDIAFQQLICKEKSLVNIINSLLDILKILYSLRGGFMSPRKIHWHFHGLSVSNKVWYAYRVGTLFKRIGWKW
jgi:glycosyltransferase involved in cell wall biosynthesis